VSVKNDGDDEVEWMGTQPKRLRRGPGAEDEVVVLDE
jgi:hypothetical protein